MEQAITTNIEKKKALLVEDEPEVRKSIQNLFKPYEDQIELDTARTAKEALDYLFPENRESKVDALILDIMLNYGSESVKKKLKGEADETSIETGILLLAYLREKEAEEKRNTLWVNVITGRNAPNVIQQIKKHLGVNGRLLTKPFNNFVLEHDITTVLGIKSEVGPILLPDNYSLPYSEENCNEP